MAGGFFDTSSGSRVINIGYGTSNHFDRVLQPDPYGYGTRIDALLLKGTRGANLWANVLDPVSDVRPSDHNLVFADVVL